MRIPKQVFAISLGLLLTVMVFVSSSNHTAYACSCMQPLSPDEEVSKYDAVFSGKVINVSEVNLNDPILSSSEPMLVTLDIDKVWKGDKKETIIVKTALTSASCGFPFVENQEYIVYAAAYNDETLEVNSCSRTSLLSDAIEDLQELNHGFSIELESMPPLKQIQYGTDPSKITCTEGLELVLKVSNGNPACIKSSSVEKLIERGWAIHVLPDYEKNENNNSAIFATGDHKVEATAVTNYFGNSNGYLAKPSTDGEYPGVIMIHEFWGLNDNIKQMAEKLASHGYVVFAVDLYDGQVGTTADEARQLRSSFEQPQWTENMNTAVSYLEDNHNPSSMGSIGWCFGGGQSLNLALNNDNMDATVIYYGQLVTDTEELSKINWPVLGVFAELDSGIPPEKVNEFESSLDEVGIENNITIYPGVNHAFANPSGDRYAPDESKDAWQKTLLFFEDNLS